MAMHALNGAKQRVIGRSKFYEGRSFHYSG